MCIYQMSDDEVHDRLAGALAKFNSTKRKGVKEAKQDKRSETSKANMAKARAAKLASLRAKKEERTQEIDLSDEEEDEDSEDSDDSDEEEEYVLKKAKKGRGKGKGQASPPVAAPADPRMDKLELLLAQLVKQKGKKKAPVRKTVIHVAPATAAVAPTLIAPPNPKAVDAKKQVMSWFD